MTALERIIEEARKCDSFGEFTDKDARDLADEAAAELSELRAENDDQQEQLCAAAAEIMRQHEDIKELRARIAEAEALIQDAAINIMTVEQLGSWRGVRAWMEQGGKMK